MGGSAPNQSYGLFPVGTPGRLHMQQVGGAIVFVGSQLAFAGRARNAAYLASKGAIVSLARSMALVPKDSRQCRRSRSHR